MSMATLQHEKKKKKKLTKLKRREGNQHLAVPYLFPKKQSKVRFMLIEMLTLVTCKLCFLFKYNHFSVSKMILKNIEIFLFFLYFKLILFQCFHIILLC
jgi:hypothetical protein